MRSSKPNEPGYSQVLEESSLMIRRELLSRGLGPDLEVAVRVPDSEAAYLVEALWSPQRRVVEAFPNEETLLARNTRLLDFLKEVTETYIQDSCKTPMLKFTHNPATEEYTAVLTSHVFVSVYNVYFSETSERRWFISIRLYRGLRVCLAQRYATAGEAMVDAQTKVPEYLRTLSARVQEALQGMENAQQDSSGPKTALERVMGEGELF